MADLMVMCLDKTLKTGSVICGLFRKVRSPKTVVSSYRLLIHGKIQVQALAFQGVQPLNKTGR